jgi:hypothetical protein
MTRATRRPCCRPREFVNEKLFLGGSLPRHPTADQNDLAMYAETEVMDLTSKGGAPDHDHEDQRAAPG